MLEHILYVALEAILSALIIANVPYMEIDWATYMQHIRLFLRGTRNYSLITGDTGAAVYPAGFIYAFTVLYALTNGGRDIFTAQWLFYAIYLLQCIMIAGIFRQCNIKPKWTILLFILSKRIHSIYLLRLFNDCICVLLMTMSMSRMLSRRFMSATIFWSLSVSIKMNSLLYAPAMALILVRETGWINALEMGCWFSLIQGFLAVPFLRKASREYVVQAFDFGRTFHHVWTVNWRFVPEYIFKSVEFKGTMFILHIATLFLLAQYRWMCREKGGVFSLLRRQPKDAPPRTPWTVRQMAIVLLECNLVGIIFARSLHYQHYSWYYHSVWLLLLMTPRLPLLFKMLLAFIVEYCWNVFPSTSMSSLLLLLANSCVLLLPKCDL